MPCLFYNYNKQKQCLRNPVPFLHLKGILLFTFLHCSPLQLAFTKVLQQLPHPRHWLRWNITFLKVLQLFLSNLSKLHIVGLLEDSYSVWLRDLRDLLFCSPLKLTPALEIYSVAVPWILSTPLNLAHMLSAMRLLRSLPKPPHKSHLFLLLHVHFVSSSRCFLIHS